MEAKTSHVTEKQRKRTQRNERILKMYDETTGMVTARYAAIATRLRVSPSTVQAVVEKSKGKR